MAEAVISGETLQIGGRSVVFPHPIGKVLEAGDLLIVLLDIPTNAEMQDNVFCVDKTGSTRWQIHGREALTPPLRLYPFSAMSLRDGKLRLVDFYGRAYLADPGTGCISSRDGDSRF